MLKKKFPHNDLHHNSNIIIQMDEKPRLKSLYMKKYIDGIKNVNVYEINSQRPAGTINYINKDADPNAGQRHLNASRRRILNDFVTRRPDGSNLDSLANRNKSDMLKGPGNALNSAKYDYGGPPTTIGAYSRPGQALI